MMTAELQVAGFIIDRSARDVAAAPR